MKKNIGKKEKRCICFCPICHIKHSKNCSNCNPPKKTKARKKEKCRHGYRIYNDGYNIATNCRKCKGLPPKKRKKETEEDMLGLSFLNPFIKEAEKVYKKSNPPKKTKQGWEKDLEEIAQKEWGWEKDKDYGWLHACHGCTILMDELKSFIAKELKRERERIVKEVVIALKRYGYDEDKYLIDKLKKLK